MKYITLKVMPKLNNEIGDIVDVVDMGGNEEVLEKVINDGLVELCEDQEVKNKHCIVLADVQDIKLQVLKTN